MNIFMCKYSLMMNNQIVLTANSMRERICLVENCVCNFKLSIEGAFFGLLFTIWHLICNEKIEINWKVQIFENGNYV